MERPDPSKKRLAKNHWQKALLAGFLPALAGEAKQPQLEPALLNPLAH
jgi:hypothetical protein